MFEEISYYSKKPFFKKKKNSKYDISLFNACRQTYQAAPPFQPQSPAHLVIGASYPRRLPARGRTSPTLLWCAPQTPPHPPPPPPMVQVNLRTAPPLAKRHRGGPTRTSGSSQPDRPPLEVRSRVPATRRLSATSQSPTSTSTTLPVWTAVTGRTP